MMEDMYIDISDYMHLLHDQGKQEKESLRFALDKIQEQVGKILVTMCIDGWENNARELNEWTLTHLGGK